MDSDLTKLLEIAGSSLTPILHRSGKILYSSAATLKPGQVYLLGLNPGGNPEEPDATHYSISKSLDQLPTKDWNDFIDESWRRRKPGESPLQRRVRWLLGELGHRTEDVCASNLIYVRSPDAQGAGYPENADICWPVHECILKIVKPSLVLTYEGRVFDYLAKRFSAALGEPFPTGHKQGWKCRSARAASGSQVFELISIPHMSRFNVIGKDHIVGWIRERVRDMPNPRASAASSL